MAKRAPRDATVYVVDDDAGMRKALARLLEAAGYRVLSYASAGDFLLAERPIALPASCWTSGCPVPAASICRRPWPGRPRRSRSSS